MELISNVDVRARACMLTPLIILMEVYAINCGVQWVCVMLLDGIKFFIWDDIVVVVVIVVTWPDSVV